MEPLKGSEYEAPDGTSKDPFRTFSSKSELNISGQKGLAGHKVWEGLFVL